jgi:uncharacterized RDD family membrane protein YckC
MLATTTGGQALAGEVGAARARIWRRVCAFAIDALAIGAVLAVLGIVLFPLTDGRVRVDSVPLNVRTCYALRALPPELGLPSDFKVTHAARCTLTFLGYVHNRVLIVSEVTRSGEVTYTRTLTFAADADGRPTSAFALDNFAIFLLVGYLLLFEWRFGSTLGKDLAGVRVQSLAGGPLAFSQAARRTLVKMLPVLILTPVLIAAMWLDPGSLLPLMRYFFVSIALTAAVGIVLLINFIVSVRVGGLAWHDRWAETEVLRGR